MTSLYEHAGGEEAIHQLEEVFHGKVLADPVLKPPFGEGRPHHVEHFDDVYCGFVRRPRPLQPGARIRSRISEEQRRRFLELYLEALDESEVPDDRPFREAVREHVEFGSKVAMQNSHAASDAELHPLRDVPRWTWPGDGETA